jgi:hypothetical protein
MPATPTAAPIRKVTFGVVAGAIVTIIIWAIKALGYQEPSPEVAAALTTLISFVISYMTPHAPNETVVTDEAGNARAATT